MTEYTISGPVDPSSDASATSVEATPAERAVRVCDVCGALDTDPRHTMWAPGAPEAVPTQAVIEKVLANSTGAFADKARQAVELLGYSDGSLATVVYGALSKLPNRDANGQALVDLFDTTWITRHIDCCSSVGCPDGSCNDILAASGNAHGDALVAHITKGQ